jgi:hypothetical protein
MASVPIIAVAGAVARRPSLWAEALRAMPALARRGWWRRAPFLPLPDPAYLAWRIGTAYGDPSGPVDGDDVVAYLAWRKRQRTG